jgi:hypothetical protein
MLTLKPTPLPSPRKEKMELLPTLQGPFADALPAWLHSYPDKAACCGWRDVATGPDRDSEEGKRAVGGVKDVQRQGKSWCFNELWESTYSLLHNKLATFLCLWYN